MTPKDKLNAKLKMMDAGYMIDEKCNNIIIHNNERQILEFNTPNDMVELLGGLRHYKFPYNLKVNSNVRYIGQNFASYSKLVNIYFGTGLEIIDDHAFTGCKNVNKIDLGKCKNLRKIGFEAFNNISPKVLIIPDNIEKIGCFAFNRLNIDKLKYVSLPKKIIGIDNEFNCGLKPAIDLCKLEGDRLVYSSEELKKELLQNLIELTQ